MNLEQEKEMQIQGKWDEDYIWRTSLVVPRLRLHLPVWGYGFNL